MGEGGFWGFCWCFETSQLLFFVGGGGGWQGVNSHSVGVLKPVILLLFFLGGGGGGSGFFFKSFLMDVETGQPPP